MADRKPKVLIVDDERINLDILVDTLSPLYEIFVAKSGGQALRQANTLNPDLILLDIMMPDMDGYEVCRRLKADKATCDIPIVFITAMSDDEDEFKGLELGAIDYLTKPVKPPLVRARIKNHIKMRTAMRELERLNRLALDANPNTGLPGNNSVTEAIETAIKNRDPACVIYADLDHFKAFNDNYGFARGDAVIRFTAQTIQTGLGAFGCGDGFIGHIGGDDFIFLVASKTCEAVCRDIIRRFDEGIRNFYDPEHLLASGVFSLNRLGKQIKHPIMSISMAAVDLSARAFDRFLEVNDACVEVKQRAKATAGSCFCTERRKCSHSEFSGEGHKKTRSFPRSGT